MAIVPLYLHTLRADCHPPLHRNAICGLSLTQIGQTPGLTATSFHKGAGVRDLKHHPGRRERIHAFRSSCKYTLMREWFRNPVEIGIVPISFNAIHIVREVRMCYARPHVVGGGSGTHECVPYDIPSPNPSLLLKGVPPAGGGGLYPWRRPARSQG